MWLLTWLPNWIFYAVLLVGVLGFIMSYFLRFIPFLYMYKTPIQIGSIVAIVIGTFMSGAIYDNNAWLDRVKEMEEKVALAEQQSKEANAVIDKKTDEVKTKIVEKQVVLKEYVDREIVKYDSTCVIPKEFIKALNDAAETPK